MRIPSISQEGIIAALWLSAVVTLGYTVFSRPDYFWANPTMTVASIIWICLSVFMLAVVGLVLFWVMRFDRFVSKHMFKHNGD